MRADLRKSAADSRRECSRRSRTSPARSVLLRRLSVLEVLTKLGHDFLGKQHHGVLAEFRFVPVFVREQEGPKRTDLVDDCDELVQYPLWAAVQHHPVKALLNRHCIIGDCFAWFEYLEQFVVRKIVAQISVVPAVAAAIVAQIVRGLLVSLSDEDAVCQAPFRAVRVPPRGRGAGTVLMPMRFGMADGYEIRRD